MIKCKKCNVLVDVYGDVCPLCNSKLDMFNEDSIYPFVKTKLSSDFVRRLILLIVLVCSCFSIVINYLLTPTIRWAGFVVAVLMSSYLVFRKIMNGRKKVLKLLFSLNFLAIILAMFWDYYTGYHGWSINYVLPSLCIFYGVFLLILRFVSYFAFRENSSSIYLNVLLEFLPLILLRVDIITFKPLAIISGLLGILNLLILIVFDGSKFKDDLAKKLHI